MMAMNIRDASARLIEVYGGPEGHMVDFVLCAVITCQREGLTVAFQYKSDKGFLEARCIIHYRN